MNFLKNIFGQKQSVNKFTETDKLVEELSLVLFSALMKADEQVSEQFPMHYFNKINDAKGLVSNHIHLWHIACIQQLSALEHPLLTGIGHFLKKTSFELHVSGKLHEKKDGVLTITDHYKSNEGYTVAFIAILVFDEKIKHQVSNLDVGSKNAFKVKISEKLHIVPTNDEDISPNAEEFYRIIDRGGKTICYTLVGEVISIDEPFNSNWKDFKFLGTSCKFLFADKTIN